MRKLQRGFTLVEILVVIAIIGVLLTVTLAAINPARQFAQANNTKRRSDVKTILDAVTQYAADNQGKLPGDGTDNTVDTDDEITVAAANISDTGADICPMLAPTYVASLPSDPKAANGGVAISGCIATTVYDTEYTIQKNAVSGGRVTVSVLAGNQELSEAISVTR